MYTSHKHITGAVTLGPTAMIVAAPTPTRCDGGTGGIAETATWPGSWRVARRYWRVGLGEILDGRQQKGFR